MRRYPAAIATVSSAMLMPVSALPASKDICLKVYSAVHVFLLLKTTNAMWMAAQSVLAMIPTPASSVRNFMNPMEITLALNSNA